MSSFIGSYVQKSISDRVYKSKYLPPYSPFLNPIVLLTDNVTARAIESVRKIFVEDCKGWIQHSCSFLDRCLALELML